MRARDVDEKVLNAFPKIGGHKECEEENPAEREGPTEYRIVGFGIVAEQSHFVGAHIAGMDAVVGQWFADAVGVLAFFQ